MRPPGQTSRKGAGLGANERRAGPEGAQRAPLARACPRVPATRRLVARFPGLLWEVLPGALGGQVGRIPSAPTTQGGGGNPQTPSGKPPGAHPNSTGHRTQILAVETS